MSALMEKAIAAGNQTPIDRRSLVKQGIAASTSSGDIEYIPDCLKNEGTLTTKIDFKVISIFGLLYLICFLDRTNIANARIAGLEKGLNMPTTGFNTCLWIFNIPFVLAEVLVTCL
jgi:hypothetical protein